MSLPKININLSPAEVLYLGKLSLRKRAELPASAVALPSVTWEVERLRVPGLDDRALTKQWMRYFSGVLASSGRQGGGDRAFVTLMKVSSDLTHFRFEAYCPNPAVINPLRDSAAFTKMADDPAVNGLNIRYKFALMEALCPVVFVWQHATQDVLVTNEHQLNHPQQFLAVDRVTSTSGLLNFIGVLNLLREADPSTAFARIPALMREAMAAKADEWLRWFAHLVEKQVFFAPKQILVDSANPETYFYDYAPTTRV